MASWTVTTALSPGGSGKEVYTLGSKNTSSGSAHRARVKRSRSAGERLPSAAAATAGAADCLTRRRLTLGATRSKRVAASGSRKNTNSSSAAPATMARISSCVNRP